MSEITEVQASIGLTTSASIGALVEALSAARAEFKPVVKDSENPYFKSKYADLANVIAATATALSKHKLSVIQSPRLAGNGHIIVTSLLAHSSGEWIKDELELPLSKFDAQGAGSAITYGRRYSYQSLLGIAADADDDGNAASPQTFTKSSEGTFKKDAPKKSAGKVGPDMDKPKQTDFPHGCNEPKPTSNVVTPENPITDRDLPDNLQGSRLPTEEEAKGFRARLIAIKDKGYKDLGPWIIKTSGKPRTNDIEFSVISRLVEQIEEAEKNGKLKELLAS